MSSWLLVALGRLCRDAIFQMRVNQFVRLGALNFMQYNYCRIHQTSRVTPAMAAGLSKTVWEIEGLLKLID